MEGSSSPEDNLIVSRDPPISAGSEQETLGITSTNADSEKTEEPTQQRRVQWPADADLSRHVSVKMASPQTLIDEGAQELLEKALAGYDPEDHQRFINSTPSSAAGSIRTSSDGDPDERMNLLKEEIEIYVDPGETHGLPSGNNKTVDDQSKKDAWNLVRTYTSGRQGFLRNRKNATARANLKEERRATVDEEKEAAGYFDAGRRRSENVGGDPLSMGMSSTATAGVGGVLSSLMALQQTNMQSGASTPGGTSLASSRASSYNGGNSSGSDDDDAREKFILEQREKRRKNAKNPIAPVARVGKFAAKAVVGTVGAVAGAVATVIPRPSLGVPRPSSIHHFASSRSSMPISRDDTDPSLRPRSALSSPSLPTTSEPSPGLHIPRGPKSVVSESVHRLKRLGEKIGIDAQARPKMARSGAGVFGGLITSTANIAGAAAPVAATLAPLASRPGYLLSRSSAPSVPTLKSLEASSKSDSQRSSFDMSPPSRTSTGLTLPRTISNVSGLPSPSKAHKPAFSLHLKDLPALVGLARPVSGHHTPEVEGGSDYFMGKPETQEQREQREWEKEKRRRKHKREKRKQEEVFIVAHVAAILARQEFIMKLARAFMMFGAPSHRLEAQMQATARVLEINCQVIYLPGVMLISFGDPATHTSETVFLKQANGLDLGKLLAAYYVYYNVIHDTVSVTEAATELDGLMIAPPRYKLWQHLIIGGLAAAFIIPSAFYGSLIDCLVAIPLGALLVLVQVVVSKNDLYSSLFEIVIVCVNSFLAAALASTGQFCFAAVASGSIVLILPGYIVLVGSLELANRSIISGSVRLVFSVLYSLFIGFAFSMGSEVYQRITGLVIEGSTDYTCSALRVDAPWWRATISPWFFFISAPCYLFVLGLRNGQPIRRKETIIMILIGSAGWVSNYFSTRAFPGRPDISSAVGSFVVGILGNLYGKFTKGSPFVVMVVGVLFQLPSGLSNGGLLQFANTGADNSAATSNYSAGFQTAESLVEVAIGLTVGLFVSAAIVNFFGGGRRRGSNLSSF